MIGSSSKTIATENMKADSSTTITILAGFNYIHTSKNKEKKSLYQTKLRTGGTDDILNDAKENSPVIEFQVTTSLLKT